MSAGAWLLLAAPVAIAFLWLGFWWGEWINKRSDDERRADGWCPGCGRLLPREVSR